MRLIERLWVLCTLASTLYAIDAPDVTRSSERLWPTPKSQQDMKGNSSIHNVKPQIESSVNLSSALVKEFRQFGRIQGFYVFTKSGTLLMLAGEGDEWDSFTGVAWRSHDEGFTWTRLVANESWMMFPRPGPRSQGFVVRSSKNTTCLIIPGTVRMHCTQDAGISWGLRHPPRPDSSNAGISGDTTIVAHPRNSNLVLLQQTEQRNRYTYYSRDVGLTWSRIEDQQDGMCRWTCTSMYCSHPNAILCMNGTSLATNPNWVPPQLILGDNFSKNKSIILPRVIHDSNFALEAYVDSFVVSLNETSARNIQVTRDGRTFIPAQGLDQRTINKRWPEWYPVRSINEGSVMIAQTQGFLGGSDGRWGEWGDLMTSDPSGVYFVKSPLANLSAKGYATGPEIEQVKGLDGILLAITVPFTAQFSHSVFQSIGTRTQISFNDGGKWFNLTPPSIDSLGKPYAQCQQDCTLHISITDNSNVDNFRPLQLEVSSEGYIGLLIANGNVGEGLVRYTNRDTFISRDAGVTWNEVAKGSHIWGIGDSGSVIVMAPNSYQITNQILVSIDQGNSWHNFTIADEPLWINKIITVSPTSSRFLVIGSRPFGFYKKVLIHVDLSKLMERPCEDDDFEMWSPRPPNTNLCFMGRKVLYQRRKQFAKCSVGNFSLKPPQVVEICPCQIEDFECEFNHERVSSGECKLIPGSKPRAIDNYCLNGSEYWYERAAYRRIALSKCEGGISLDIGKQHSCHKSHHRPTLLLDAGRLLFESFIFLNALVTRRLWYYLSSRLTMFIHMNELNN